MRPGRRYRIVGFTLLALAAALAAVGQHDGVVGMTPPDAFPAPGQGPAEVVTRVVVDGPLEGDHPARTILSAPEGSVLVKAHMEQPDPTNFIIVVLPRGDAPPAGTILVVAGSVQTLLVGTAGHGSAIVRLDARDVREPVWF